MADQSAELLSVARVYAMESLCEGLSLPSLRSLTPIGHSDADPRVYLIIPRIP